MARALSNARLFSAVSDLSTVLLSQKNFSVPSSNPVSKAIREDSRKVMKRVEGKMEDVSGEKTLWMPETVTGNFIPEDQFGQTDFAKLRQMLTLRFVLQILTLHSKKDSLLIKGIRH